MEEDLESPNSGLSHFASALVSRCRELSGLPRCCVIVKTEDCIDKEKCSKRCLIPETLFSSLSPQMMSQNTSSLPLNSLLLKLLVEVAPDREVGLNCAPSSTTGKDSNFRRTSRESLPPSPPPGLSPLHFGIVSIQRFLTSDPELAMICTECTEGMKATKRKRRRTMTTLTAEFFGSIAVNFHRRS